MAVHPSLASLDTDRNVEPSSARLRGQVVEPGGQMAERERNHAELGNIPEIHGLELLTR